MLHSIRWLSGRVLVGIVGIVIVGILVLGVSVRRAEASAPKTPKVQLVTQSFPMTALTSNNLTTFTTMQQITFTAAAQGQLQVTTFYTFNFQSDEVGQGGVVTCNLVLDGTTIDTLTTTQFFAAGDQEAAMTTTQTVSSGSHVLALSCAATNQANPPETDITGDGTSLIVRS